MGKWFREKLDPVLTVKNTFGINMPAHISYDPDMRWSDRQYYRAAACSNDGTLSLTIDCLARCLDPLLAMQSYHIPSVPDDTSNIVGIRYKIGKIYHSRVYGMVNLPCGRYPGQRESFRIPVKSEFIFRKD